MISPRDRARYKLASYLRRYGARSAQASLLPA
jgi:hypothetical protein